MKSLKVMLSALVSMLAGCATVPRATAPHQVRVTGGLVQGSVRDGVLSFKGIPFAAPPVGNLRWRPPQIYPDAPSQGSIRLEIGGGDSFLELLDAAPVPPTLETPFNASGARVPFPESPVDERCYVALIDPEPATTRWAHPAPWAFVPADGQGDVILLAGRAPSSTR
jgi:hypothetical protein